MLQVSPENLTNFFFGGGGGDGRDEFIRGLKQHKFHDGR